MTEIYRILTPQYQHFQNIERIQCLAALMSNPHIRDWVMEESLLPGSGGQIGVWTKLAKEYVEEIIK